jgi:hypothetical protein
MRVAENRTGAGCTDHIVNVAVALWEPLGSAISSYKSITSTSNPAPTHPATTPHRLRLALLPTPLRHKEATIRDGQPHKFRVSRQEGSGGSCELDAVRDSMAVNRIRGAFAAPRKGETFELRAGLVYELPCRHTPVQD